MESRYVLSLLDRVWLQRWQLLEFTSLAMGHLQGRPQAMGPVPAMLPSSLQYPRKKSLDNGRYL